MKKNPKSARDSNVSINERQSKNARDTNVLFIKRESLKCARH